MMVTFSFLGLECALIVDNSHWDPMGSLKGSGMALRAGGIFAVVLTALAGVPGPAAAQFLPPLQQLFPNPFRPPAPLPPAAIEEDPAFDVAPGYGRQAPGAYGRSRNDVTREDLPPPGYEPDPRYR